MTNDKQIEYWRKEFELIAGKSHAISKNESGNYRDEDTAFLWLGFLMAKRSMPIVKIDMLSRFGSPDDILACISEAGIKYTVG